MIKFAILASLLASPALAGGYIYPPDLPSTGEAIPAMPPIVTPPTYNGVSPSGEYAQPRYDGTGNGPRTTKQHEMFGN